MKIIHAYNGKIVRGFSFALLLFLSESIALADEVFSIAGPFYGILHRDVVISPNTARISVPSVEIIEFPHVRNKGECNLVLAIVKEEHEDNNYTKEECTQMPLRIYKDAYYGISIPDAFSIKFKDELTTQGIVDFVYIFYLAKPEQFRGKSCLDAIKAYSAHYTEVGCAVPKTEPSILIR